MGLRLLQENNGNKLRLLKKPTVVEDTPAMARTKQYEGWRSTPYQDPGGANRSIAWGFNIDDPFTASMLPDDVKSGERKYTEEEANPVFRKKYAQAEIDAKTYLGEDVFNNSPQRIKDTVTDISYNIGLPRLKKFKGFKKAIEAGDFSLAADELQYRDPTAETKEETPYYKAVGGRARDHIASLREEPTFVEKIAGGVKRVITFPIAPPGIEPVVAKTIWDKAHEPTKKVYETIKEGISGVPEPVRDRMLPKIFAPWEGVLDTLRSISEEQEGVLSYPGVSGKEIREAEQLFQEEFLAVAAAHPVSPEFIGIMAAHSVVKPFGFKEPTVTSDLAKAFKTLGIKPDSTAAQAEKAYTGLTLKYHPDRITGIAEKLTGEAKFKEIGNAIGIIRKANAPLYTQAVNLMKGLGRKGPQLSSEVGGVRIPSGKEITAIAKRFKLSNAQVLNIVESVKKGAVAGLPGEVVKAVEAIAPKPPVDPTKQPDLEPISKKPDVTPSLTEEAKKYDRVEDFVEAQGREKITVYRGIGSQSKEGGNYWSTNKEWARQFTQTGREEEVRKVSFQKNAIYKADKLPSAVSELEIDIAIKEAKEKGYNAILVDEGKNEPNSVFVINPSKAIRVPKQQLTDIYNKAKGTSLTEEAKKYDRVEDFVGSQVIKNPVLWRGQRGKYKQGILSGGGIGKGLSSSGKGLYVTTDKGYAKQYGETKAFINAMPGNPLRLGRFEELYDWLLKDSNEKNIRDFNKKYKVEEYLLNKGYDGIVNSSRNEIVNFKPENVRVFDTKKEATTFQKQQLTDIYNKAKGIEGGKVPPNNVKAKLTKPVAKTPPEPISSKQAKPLIQGRINQLESELKSIDKQMRILEKEQKLLEKKGIATGSIDKQLQDLSTKFNYVDSSIAELMIGQPQIEEMNKEIAQMKIGEILKEEGKVARKEFSKGKLVGTTKEKARIAEVKLKTRARKSKKQEIQRMVKDINNIDVSKMSPQEAEPIKKLLKNIDLVKRQKPTMLSLAETKEFLTTYPEAEMPDWMLERLARLDKRNLNDITIEELDTIHKSIMHYAKLNQTKNMIKVGREIRRANQVLSDSKKEMKPQKKVKTDIVQSQKSKLGKLKKTGTLIKDTFGVRHDHYDLIVETLAGPNSTMDKVLYREVKEGKIKELSHRQNTFSAFQKDLDLPVFMEKYKIRDLANWQNEKIQIGKFNLTKGERMSLYRHSLNENNLRHILGGGFGLKHSESPLTPHQITGEELNNIIESLTDAELEFAGQPVSNLFDNQHESLNDVFYKKNGYSLPKEENYYPIDVMETALPQELEANSILEELKHKWVRIGLKKGMLINRIKSKLPIYLNNIAYDINKSVLNSAAYVGLEIPLSNASKLLYNKNFRAEIYLRYGKQTWVEIEKGLRDIAGDWQSYTTVEELAMKIKNKLSTAILGVNPFVMAKQVLSYSLYSVYVKPEYLMRGFIDYASHPFDTISRHKIYSPEYAERLESGYSRDVADVFKTGASERVYKGKTSIPEKLMSGVKFFDQTAVTPGMQGAMLQVLDEFKIGKLSPEVKMALDITEKDVLALSPEDKMKLAYKFADWVTERTQPMFSPEHRSSLSRGTAIEKLATQFSSFTNQALNLIRRVAREAHRTKDPKQYAKLMKTLFLLLVVNSAGVYAIDSIRDWMFKREKKKTYGEAILDSVASYFIFIRDIESSVVSKVKYGTFMGYDVSLPIISAANLLSDTIANGVGFITDDTKSKRTKRANHFIDGAIELLLLSQGIPYKTPKKLVTAPFKKEKKGKKRKLRLLRGGGKRKLRLLR